MDADVENGHGIWKGQCTHVSTKNMRMSERTKCDKLQLKFSGYQHGQ